MIRYERMLFFPTLLTASDWFIDAMFHTGQRSVLWNQAEPGGGNLLKVALVRHPCRWLSDCYRAVNTDTSLIRLTRLQPWTRLRNGSVGEFVEDYLRSSPGAVGKLFDACEVDTCIRVEDLPYAFLELLESLDIVRPPTLPELLHCPATRMEPEHWRRVVRAERDFCERYDYY